MYIICCCKSRVYLHIPIYYLYIATVRPNFIWNNGIYGNRKLLNCTECRQNVQSTYKLSSNKQVFSALLFRFRTVINVSRKTG